MSDVIQRLTAARPDHLNPDAVVDESTRRTELAGAMSEFRRPERARRRVLRPMWAIGLVGGAAAAAVAVAAVTTGGGGGNEVSAVPGPARTKVNAQNVLLAAAHQAERQPASTGAFWHSRALSVHYMAATAGGASFTVAGKSADETWTPVDPRGYIWWTSQRLEAAPSTAADRAIWEKAGSPGEVSLAARKPGGVAGLGKYPLAAGKKSVDRSRPTDKDKIFWLGRNVSMKDLLALPSDPAKLKAALLKWYEGHGTESSSDKVSADEWLYAVTRGLILDMPAKPGVRGAAFRMLAGLKGVTLIDKAQDAAGRTGSAVKMIEVTPNGVLEHRILFDSATGRGLGDQIVVVKPGGINAGLPVGSLLTSRVVQEAGWTDTVPSMKPTSRR